MRLVLASMPWAIFNRPSIQLGALAGYLRQNEADIEIEICHPYLDAAKKIGLGTYRILSEDSWAGEALYCSLLFPEMREQAKKVFYRSLGKKIPLPADFDLLKGQLDDHLDDWLRQQDFSSVDLVGFSVCFGQLPATLLAANRLKKQYPGLKIVLGGSTCVPAIGSSLLWVFPYIDYIVAGEGEGALVRLCRFLQGTMQEPGPGILFRQDGFSGNSPQEQVKCENEVKDINTLPIPDYDPYFNELKRSGLGFIPEIPVEFSRGCWWNKCTFCNLNLQWCGYRAKTSERMLREVDLMANRYRCLDFAFTDNALPPGQAERFFQATKENRKDLLFFGEIRTKLKPEQYAVFRNGGLDSIQIGIEAFSNSLLKKMHKGVTVMDNLSAMKFCSEAGIKLDGNLILEFPGSTENEVQETLRAMDFVLPFHPLTGAGFFLGHGSPVWNNPKKYSIRSIRHHPFNTKLYPRDILENLELLIMQGTGDRGHQKLLWQPVRKKLDLWKQFHENRESDLPPLSYRDGGEFIIIRQERPGQQTLHHRLSATSRNIYLACRTPVAIKSLLTTYNSVTERALNAFLGDLENKKLIFREGDMCLALAVSRSMDPHCSIPPAIRKRKQANS